MRGLSSVRRRPPQEAGNPSVAWRQWNQRAGMDSPKGYPGAGDRTALLDFMSIFLAFYRNQRRATPVNPPYRWRVKETLNKSARNESCYCMDLN